MQSYSMYMYVHTIYTIYGTAQFKLDTRECSTRVYFVTRSECF